MHHNWSKDGACTCTMRWRRNFSQLWHPGNISNNTVLDISLCDSVLLEQWPWYALNKRNPPFSDEFFYVFYFVSWPTVISSMFLMETLFLTNAMRGIEFQDLIWCIYIWIWVPCWALVVFNFWRKMQFFNRARNIDVPVLYNPREICQKVFLLGILDVKVCRTRCRSPDVEFSRLVILKLNTL